MISHMETRLVRWGRWLTTNRGQGSAGMSASMEPMPRSNYRTTVVPRINLDASRTHEWVKTCSAVDQRLLFMAYIECQTVTAISIKLDVTRTTVYNRLHKLQAALAAFGAPPSAP